MDFHEIGNEHDQELRDLLLDFEGALREHLKTSEEFQSLLEYLTKKHGALALYVTAQIMGGSHGGKKKKRAKRRVPPLRFELTRGDLKFLRSLKISSEI